MEVTNSAASASGATAAALGSAAQDVLGKDDFLQLLITQLRYQDPLNPVENEAFIAQLAQFSSLEQIQNMNESLQTSIGTDLLMARSISNSMVTNLIGKEVRIQTNQIAMGDDGDVSLGFQSDAATASATVSIYDESGSLVFSKNLTGIEAGENDFEWDGEDNSGKRVPPGSYRFEVSLTGPDEQVAIAPTWLSGEVTAIKYVADGAVISVGDQLFNVGDVLEVRSKE